MARRRLERLERVLGVNALFSTAYGNVVMGLPQRIAGASVFGSTLETVLADRPCRVIIESRPPAMARGRRA